LSKAQALADNDIKDALKCNYIMEPYDETILKAYMEKLVPENMILV